MGRFKVLGVVSLAVFALGVVMASSASAALPQLLNAKKEVPALVTFKGSGTELKFATLAGKEVKCTSYTSTTEINTEGRLGPFHIDLTGCTVKEAGLTLTCTGLGDATSGLILALGTVHFVFTALSPPTLAVAALLLLEPVHFLCKSGIIEVLLKVLGSQLCSATPINKLEAKGKIICSQSAAGDAAETKYENNAGEAQTVSLLTGFADAEKEEDSSQVTALTTTALVGGVETAIELMG
jgi:hypothetical protein